MSSLKIADRLTPLFNSVKSKTGIDISNFKHTFLERRIQYRMRLLDLDNYADYLNLLARDCDEAKMLYLALSINVTKFFRDPSVWDFLDNIATDYPYRWWRFACQTARNGAFRRRAVRRETR